jgi:hypothetical protein
MDGLSASLIDTALLAQASLHNSAVAQPLSHPRLSSSLEPIEKLRRTPKIL